MIVDVTDLDDEIVYNARPGPQTLKIIEVSDRIDEAKRDYLLIKFINQWGEYHAEPFYPQWQRRKLREIAYAIGDPVFVEPGIFDTSLFVGGYIHADVTPVETQRGGISRGMFLRDIRKSPRRYDPTGSPFFNKQRRSPRRKKRKADNEHSDSDGQADS